MCMLLYENKKYRPFGSTVSKAAKFLNPFCVETYNPSHLETSY